MDETMVPCELKFLSHLLSPQTPGFGGQPGFATHFKRQIQKGDSSNSSEWTLSNHIGTHVDLPYHFSENGKKLQDFGPNAWVFVSPFLIDIHIEPGELISPTHPYEWTDRIPEPTDLLLIRTHFENRRSESAYWNENPGISAELARFLRKHCPKVRGLGFDFLSVTAFQKRAEGREAHQALLDPNLPGNPILVFEDMSLVPLSGSPLRVICSPLRVEGADGAPVTVFAECRVS